MWRASASAGSIRAATKLAAPKAIEHGEALQIGADAGIEELLRPGQGRDGFRRSVTLQRHERISTGDLQRQFERLAVRAICQARDQRKARIDIAVRLLMGRARKRQFRRLEPIARRRLARPASV